MAVLQVCKGRRELRLLRHLGCISALQWGSCASERRQLSSSPTLEATRATLEAAGIRKVLVANRGEIACRVMATARKLGLTTVAVFSEADRSAAHVQAADEAYCIGPAAAKDSYLRSERILDVASRAGAQAIHPGYGFLSENAAFSDTCALAGVRFVGPSGAAIRAMGDKAAAKAAMVAAGVPVVPGYHGDEQAEARLMEEARSIGFPLLVKAVSGGGGKGMKLANSIEELPGALASAQREAKASFGDDRVLLERYIKRPRHVEVQIVADSHGNAVYVFDRDCSLQRRHQKIIEEAPAPGLPASFHDHIGRAAVRTALAVGYVNAGTVEFIVDMDSRPGETDKEFFFMEMNTRLQVEHPVSEAVAGVDLVEWQLGVVGGGRLPLTQEQVLVNGPRGHAFEARLYAESPRNSFLPGAGRVRRWRPTPGATNFQLPSYPSSHSVVVPGLPPGTTVRVDSGVREGDEVGINYDPMIAKIVTWGPDRDAALAALRAALASTQVAGLPTNLAYLRRLAVHPAFSTSLTSQELDTGFIGRHSNELLSPQALPPSVAVLAAVSRWLMQAAEDAASGAAGSTSGSTSAGTGAWGVQDAKRLWHHAVRQYRDMAFPEGLLQSAAVAAVGAGGGAGSKGQHAHHGHSHGHGHGSSHSSSGPSAGLEVSITVLSHSDFDVTVGGLPPAVGTSHTSASGGSHSQAGSHSHSSSHTIKIRGARLSQPSQRQTGAVTAAAGSSGSSGHAGILEAEVDGKRVCADVVGFRTGGSGEGVINMWLEGEAYELRWPIQSWSRHMGLGGHAAGGKVAAPMPGRVVKVAAKEGDMVKAGAVLVVLEAMKMEHQVVAPRAGVVRGVSAAPGAQVTDGQVLCWVDDPAEVAKEDVKAKSAAAGAA